MDKLDVAKAMIRYGGDFVVALGGALIRADRRNTQRIKEAFPEYWERYTELAKKDKESHG